MATTKRIAAGQLHLLAARQVQAAGEGDHSYGGGLLLRVRRGFASFGLRFTSPVTGKRREMGLGTCHRGSVAQAGESLICARDLAHKARELLRNGTDPLIHREGIREAGRKAEADKKAEKAKVRWTLARCARDYHERVIEPTRTGKHSAQWISSLENHMPTTLWLLPVADVTAPALLEVLGQIKPHVRARNLTQDNRIAETMQRIRQRLEAVFDDAIFHGRATVNPAAAVKRKMRESLPKKKAGNFAALPYKEAPALLARLRDARGTAARCLEFAVLTAARTGEALGAVWSEFDLDAGVWLVPAERMKSSGKEDSESHTVHLSVRALAVLKAQLGQDNNIVFPSPMLHGKPLSNMAMLTMLTRLGVRDQTTVHGLCRATFSTWAYDTAAARPDVIEACLAHREADKVKAAYNRAQFMEERRALLAAWSNYLAQPPAQVLTFGAKAA